MMNNEFSLYSHEKRYLDANYTEPEALGRCTECFCKVYAIDEPFLIGDEYICDIGCLANWCLKAAGNIDFIEYSSENDFFSDEIEDLRKFAMADKYAFSEWYQGEHDVNRVIV